VIVCFWIQGRRGRKVDKISVTAKGWVVVLKQKASSDGIEAPVGGRCIVNKDKLLIGAKLKKHLDRV